MFHAEFVSIVELTGMLPGTFCLFLFRDLALDLLLAMVDGFAVQERRGCQEIRVKGGPRIPRESQDAVYMFGLEGSNKGKVRMKRGSEK